MKNSTALRPSRRYCVCRRYLVTACLLVITAGALLGLLTNPVTERPLPAWVKALKPHASEEPATGLAASVGKP